MVIRDYEIYLYDFVGLYTIFLVSIIFSVASLMKF